jgi:VWFA-related protein
VTKAIGPILRRTGHTKESARREKPYPSGASHIDTGGHTSGLMHMRKTIFSIVLLILFFGAAIYVRTYEPAAVQAQNSSAPAAAQPPAANQPAAQAAGQVATPIRSATRLVQVNVVAHDKHGNPVTDLTKDDFTVFDEKKQQAIQVFSMQSNQLPEHPPAALPPDTYTNRIEEKAEVPTSVTVILLDGLNTKFEDQLQARKQVIQFLQQIQPQDRVALYTLDSEVQIIHDFTSDASSLLAALAIFNGRANTEVDKSVPEQTIDLSAVPGTEELQAFLDGSAQVEANANTRDRVRLTVDALVAIADHLGSLPGRKNLVWVSGSFPFSVGVDTLDMSSNNEQLRFDDDVARAARALTDANLAVYPVDARGLIAVSSKMNASVQSQRPRRGAAPSRGPAPAPSAEDFSTLDVMADRTGGKAFYNSNDIFGAIRRALDDSRVTYNLGYYPQGVAWDGKFHDIKVGVKRPGVEIRARKGYFAISEKSTEPQEVNAVIADAARSPLEATAIGLHVGLQSVDSPGPSSLRTQIHIDLQELSLQLKEGRWAGTIVVGIAQLGADDKILSGISETLNLSLDPGKYETALKKGLVYRKDIPVVPGSTELRVILLDVPTGNLGSVGIPLAKYVVPGPITK